jgi:hypothetical protein
MVVPRRRTAEHDLGRIVAVSRGPSRPGIIVLALGVFVLFVWAGLCATTVLFLRAQPLPRIGLVVGFESLMLVPVGLYAMVYGFTRRLVEVAVHEGGVRLRDRASRVALRWHEIECVYESLEEIDTPIGKRLEGRFVLEARSGRRLVIAHGLARHAEIGTLAATTAQLELLPAYETTLAAGSKAAFGPLTIDAYGIHTRDAAFAWTHIAYVRWERVLYRGSYVIQLTSGQVGARIPSEHVPNPRVLLAVLERYGKLERPKETVVAEVLGVAVSAA